LAVRTLVWDLPTRLFHWSLVGLIAFSWWSAEYDHVDWHIWSGIAVLTALVFRLLWGLFGSSTARFSSFVRGPRAIVAYLRGGSNHEIGHSPLGGLSVVALLLVTSIQVGLGLFSEDEDGLFGGPLAHSVSVHSSEFARELHEANWNLLLALMALHVGAILFYRLFRGERLTSAMITGKRAVGLTAQPLRRAKWWMALVCLAAAFAFSRWIVAGAPPFGS
jgi:cytochrome b